MWPNILSNMIYLYAATATVSCISITAVFLSLAGGESIYGHPFKACDEQSL